MFHRPERHGVVHVPQDKRSRTAQELGVRDDPPHVCTKEDLRHTVRKYRGQGPRHL